MDDDNAVQSDADNAYEFISEGELRSFSDDANELNSLDSGVPLSSVESTLAKRVRDLKKENKEIRYAVDNYQEALQLCQENLNNLIARNGELRSETMEKYNQAKIKVQHQNEKILSLEKQLQDEKKKHLELEEATKIQVDNQQSEKDVADNVEVLDKNNVNEKVSSLCQFVCTLSELSPDEFKTKMSPDLQEAFINMSVAMEKSIKPLVKSDLAAVEKENDSALQDELKSVKEQLKQKEGKCAELEKKTIELQGLIESKTKKGADVSDVQEELKLLNRDLDEMDMIRAGCVSHDSEPAGTEGILNLGEKEQQMQQKFEAEKMELLKEIKENHAGFAKLETNFLASKEKILKDKEKVSKENEDLTRKLSEYCSKNEELKVKLEAYRDEVAEAVAARNKIEQELMEQTARNETIERQLRESIAINEQLKTKLGETDLQFRQELQKKEGVENELKAQVYSFYQELQGKEMECENWKAKCELSDTECNKMNSALAEMREELNAVYLENERLAERKGASGAEMEALQSKIDNLTAQLLSAEEMLENKEHDYRTLQHHQENLTSELETLPVLRQQLEVFRADFNTEQETKQKVEEDNRKLRDKVAKLQAEIERLVEELSDPTGSRMAEMQRRHGCGGSMAAGNNDPWAVGYNNYIAPRGPASARYNTHLAPQDYDITRQVSGGRCPKCDRMFPDLDTLQTHVVECLESESTGSVGGRICPKCQGSFPDLDTLQIHVMECLDN